MIESVPSCHHFKTTEHSPVNRNTFLAAVYKEVSSAEDVVCY